MEMNFLQLRIFLSNFHVSGRVTFTCQWFHGHLFLCTHDYYYCSLEQQYVMAKRGQGWFGHIHVQL